MAKKEAFRYNTGATKVPWAAVGENYNAEDLYEVVKFMMQGEGPEYDAALEAVKKEIYKLDELSYPPANLSLGPKVREAEAMPAPGEPGFSEYACGRDPADGDEDMGEGKEETA